MTIRQYHSYRYIAADVGCEHSYMQWTLRALHMNPLQVVCDELPTYNTPSTMTHEKSICRRGYLSVPLLEA